MQLSFFAWGSEIQIYREKFFHFFLTGKFDTAIVPNSWPTVEIFLHADRSTLNPLSNKYKLCRDE